MTDNRRIDALVAEHVMGWGWHHGLLILPSGHPAGNMHWAAEWDDNGRPHWLPHYSTSIAAAWEVVENLRHDLAASFNIDVEGPSDWVAKFTWTIEDYWCRGVGRSDSAPTAICLAALKSKGIDV